MTYLVTFSILWACWLDNINLPKVYTPEQVAEILQLSKNTIYDLIARGEIVAKRIGRIYRIPANSISFVFSGLDIDFYQAEEKDLKKISQIQKELARVRLKL